MFSRIKDDIECIFERDPAAKSRFEVLTCYPGLHALILHRLAHAFWGMGWWWLGRFLSHLSRFLTGIEIHPAAKIGKRVFFDHAMGVVVGETAEIGDGCTIYQGVTLGGTSLYKGTKRHPTLGADVVVGAGAKVLGGFEVGAGARIGSNAVVTKPVPAGATAIGNPARIIEKPSGTEVPQDPKPSMSQGEPTLTKADQPANANFEQGRHPAQGESIFSAYGITQTDDPVAQSIKELSDRAMEQERLIQALQMELNALKEGAQRTDSHQA